MAPPGGSTCVWCEPPAQHFLMGMWPPSPPPETGGLAARDKQQARAFRLAPSRSLSTWSSLPHPNLFRRGQMWSPTPKACPSLLLLSREVCSGYQRMSSPHYPPRSLYWHELLLGGRAEAGAQEPDLQAHLALQSLPASRTQAWPVPLSASPRTQAGLWHGFAV